MTVTTKRSLIALLLSLVLVVSLFTVGISATDVTTTSSEEVTSAVEETTAATEDASESSSESTTETEEVVDTSAADATKKSLIINGIIIGVIVIIGVVLFIKFRVKLMNFFRSVKSELGKVVWSSKEQTRKGFIVVIIVTVIFAVGLWVIDFAFSYGISELANLFN
ncbi:MAG: preprotein translocase subunit SecE [Clostridia bacterium]|nr:preprotein translocase subunit SecE [Clostridia bacterium]